jgi:hypothetical protein
MSIFVHYFQYVERLSGECGPAIGDFAVTSIADMTPENISITAPLLGHINPKTTEKHYIHASQVTAGRHYRSSVSSLRKLLAKEFN